MKKINRRWGLLAGVWLIGCTGTAALNEPPGTAVTLTPEDLSKVNFAYDDMKAWAAWEGKGNRLRIEGSYQEALYCYHQAMAAWPKKLADSEPEKRRNAHQPVPTDTLIQKGLLYLKLKEPKLALHYLKLHDSYFPGNPIAAKGIAEAEAMLKQS